MAVADATMTTMTSVAAAVSRATARGGRDFGGKRDGKRFEKGDKRGGFKGDKRGGRDFGGKRGGKKNFSVDFDDED